jgi:hypothetical protein
MIGRKPEFTPDKAPTSVLASDFCVPALPVSFVELPVAEHGFLDAYQCLSLGWSRLQARKAQAVRNEAIRLRHMYFGIFRERLEEVIGNDHGIQ